METLKKFGIDLSKSHLLPIALTHTSYANEHNCVSYERLEFLGDAVLELVSSDYIYKSKRLTEGEMSKFCRCKPEYNITELSRRARAFTE